MVQRCNQLSYVLYFHGLYQCMHLFNSIFFLPFFSSIFIAKAQQGQSIVKPGSLLTPTTNSSQPSNSGLHAFGFYKQGNGYAVGVFLAGIPQKTIFWTANRQSSSSCWCQIEFQNWWKYSSAICTKHWDKHYHFSWRCNISIHEGVTSASMLDPGNFVVFNSDNNTIWQSFEHPTNTFLATQHLSDSTLYSSVSKSDQSTGIFRLYAVGTALLPENTLTGVLLHMEMEVMWHYALLMMVISTYSIPLAHTSTIWLKEDIQGKIEST